MRDGVRTKDYFGYADGFDGKRYPGLVFGEPPRNIVIDESSVLVQPGVAAKQVAEETGTLPQPDPDLRPPRPDSGVPTPGPRPATKPRRFYGTTRLNAARLSSSARQVDDEIVQHLKALVGSDVEVILEIHATVPDGIPDNVVRTISENAATLKFDPFGFEEEKGCW